ncbi:MAG: hypothetical protein P1V35_11705 [Planctomycetota bacterium]|nr:hypothetical protein [Planctomycetota bacterium]
MALTTLFALSAFAAPVQAPAPTVIFTEIASSPTSLVPGTMGNRFDGFYEVRASPSGNHWVLTCENTNSNSSNDMTLVDGNLLFFQSFTPLPWDATQSWFSGWTDVNDAGHLLVASGNTPSVGGSWGFFLDPRLTADGRDGFRSELLGTTTSSDEAQHFDGTLLTQSGVTIPPGQSGSLSVQSVGFGPNGFEVTDDGMHTLSNVVLGDLVNSIDAVLYDGSVVLEEGVMISGAGFTEPVNRVDGVHMTPDGDWYAWGRNDPNAYRNWVVRNGTVIAQSSQPIIPGSSESWFGGSAFGETFVFARGNSSGDSLVYGATQGGSSIWALVRNGADIIMRAGDPVDVDGNGMFDDNANVGAIKGMSDWTSSGDIYLIADLSNDFGSFIGQGVLKLELVDDTATGIAFCDPADNNSTGVPTLLTGSTGSGVGSGVHLELANGPPNQLGYFLVSTGRNVPGIAISQGHLCLAGSLGRYNVSGGVHNSVGLFDASGMLQNLAGTATSTGGTGYDVPSTVPIAGNPTIVAGSIWNFQLWHREDNGESNFSNGLAVIF